MTTSPSNDPDERDDRLVEIVPLGLYRWHMSSPVSVIELQQRFYGRCADGSRGYFWDKARQTF